MSGIATAVVASAAVGAYASNKASKAQSKAIKEGAATEAEVSRENLAFQKELAQQQREDFAPWRDVGQQALDKIWTGVQSGEFDVSQYDPGKFDPSSVDVTQDPGYLFRLEQGQKAQEAGASARGRVLSGAQLKAMEEYSQGVASQEYGNAYARALQKYATDIDTYNRQLDRSNRNLNILSNLSTGGQSSAAGQAQSSQALGATSGNILSNLGRSQNIAQQNLGAVRAGAYGDQAQIFNQAAQNWLTYKMNS